MPAWTASAVTVSLILLPATAGYAAAAAEAQRDRVRWQAQSDSRWEVRSAAAAALTSNRTGTIADWLATGYSSAVRRAASFERSNITEIMSAVKTSTTDSITHLAGVRALVATHDEKDEFVRYGLAEARRRDAAGDQQHHGEVAKLTAEDRAFVAQLAVTDPGAQVRSAASLAAGSGHDEDLAEFFEYYWSAGARLDDEAYRLKSAEIDSKGNAALQRLRAVALAARSAEQEASGEVAVKLHAETVAAWSAVNASAEATSVDWSAERDRAAAQAAAWQQVAGYAEGATTEQDWSAVTTRAGASLDAWTAAVQEANRQMLEWRAIATEASTRGGGLS